MGVQAALTSIREAVDELNAAELWTRSDVQAMAEVREYWVELQRLEAGYAALVADLENRVLPDGLSTKAFLRSALHRAQGQAAADARAGTSPLPKCREVFAAGGMSRAHLDVITSTVAQISQETRNREVPRRLPELLGSGPEPVCILEAVDAYLAYWATVHDSQALKNVTRALLAALDPDHDDGFDPNAHEQRAESHARDDHGMLYGHLNLSAADGAAFAHAIDALSAPLPARKEQAEDGTIIEIKDTRTAPQRRADAVGQMARLAMSAAEAGTQGRRTPQDHPPHGPRRLPRPPLHRPHPPPPSAARGTRPRT